MDRVNRESRKIVLDNVHVSSVSKAIWPMNTRKNTFTVSHKIMQSRRRRLLSYAGIARTIRIAVSLCVASLALVLGIFYSWTIQLILSLICAIITLIIIHLLFDTDIHRTKLGAISYPTTSHKRQLRGQNTNRLGTSINPSSPYPSDEDTHTPLAIPVSVRLEASPNLTSACPSEDTQAIQHHQPSSIMPFPTTPMPLTPVIRVLETIDLSSTGVEHFLEMYKQEHHTAKSPSERGQSEQEQPPKAKEE